MGNGANTYVGKIVRRGSEARYTDRLLDRAAGGGAEPNADRIWAILLAALRAAAYRGQSATVALPALHRSVRPAIPAERHGAVSGKALLVGARLSAPGASASSFLFGDICPLHDATLEISEIVADLIQGESERENVVDILDGMAPRQPFATKRLDLGRIQLERRIRDIELGSRPMRLERSRTRAQIISDVRARLG